MLTHQFQSVVGEKPVVWSIVFDVYLLERVETECGVDLTKLFAGDGADAFSSARKLVEVLYVVVERQCEQQGVTPEMFGRSIAGDVIDDAAVALLQGVANFYPRRRRVLMEAMTAKGMATATLATDRLAAIVDRISPESLLDATSSPASSASTPAP